MTENWTKPTLTLLVVGALAWLLPETSIDPWNLISSKKVATMLFALAVIQILGSILSRILEPRAGAILTGFLGGLVSSTATTAALARRSKTDGDGDDDQEILIFLSATGAMLCEGLALVWMGTSDFHASTSLIFIGPLLATGAMIYLRSRTEIRRAPERERLDFEVMPILKLALFIVSILVLSKLLQRFFGEYGLMILTFLVSLFEIHGSVIANVQLHESGAFGARLLGGLVALSIVASYLSKIFLISTLGSRQLRSYAIKSTLILFSSLAVVWLLSYRIEL